MYLKRLKEIRLANNFNQAKVADVLGIDRSTYSSFEIGRDTIPIERLNIFVNFFNTSFDYIFEFTDIYNYSDVKNDIDINEVAIRLKATRKECKCTQEYIALELNTNHSVWCRYEQAKFLINTNFLYSYSKLIKCSADYLLGKIDSPKYLK